MAACPTVADEIVAGLEAFAELSPDEQAELARLRAEFWRRMQARGPRPESALATSAPADGTPEEK